MSFSEFYIDDIIYQNRRSNPLLRFLKSIFYKKKEMLLSGQTLKSDFMKTMRGLHEDIHKKYDKKTRIFVGEERLNPIRQPQHEVIHTFKGKLTSTYIVKKKQFGVTDRLNSEPAERFKDFGKFYEDIYYQVKEPKKLPNFRPRIKKETRKQPKKTRIVSKLIAPKLPKIKRKKEKSLLQVEISEKKEDSARLETFSSTFMSRYEF